MIDTNTTQNMSQSLLKNTLMVNKNTLLSAFLLTIAMNAAFANSNLVQIKSIDKVYIKLDIRKGSLENILDAIESKTDYSFFYTEKNLRDKSNIELSTIEGTVADVLLEVANKKNLHFKQVNNVISVKSLASEISSKKIDIEVNDDFVDVSGTITSESGETLPGVAISIEGTK